jgi:branched-chain amino acid aminotransferase
MATGSLRIWIDGHVYDEPVAARVPATDHGLVVGNGVFETCKVTEAGVFAVSRHLERLTRSARALGLAPPHLGAVRDGIAAVVDGRAYAFGRLRITYTGGTGPLSSQAPYGPATLVVAADATTPAAEVTDIVTAPWTRNERGALTGVKSTSYAENVRALAYATERSANEAIFVNTMGNLSEGTGSNVFLVFGSEVVTPPLTAGPLAGITRELLLEWAPIAETDVRAEDAARADEVFLTSSLRDVQAVRAWDDVLREAPGPHTALLAKIFTERAADDLDP